MTVEAAPPQQAAYSWNLTLTLREDYDSLTATTREEHRVVTDADELVDVVLRTSYDPRVVAYHYERQSPPDLSSAPSACPDCDEPYGGPQPQQRWHGPRCGGHLVYQCVTCGQSQVHPPLVAGCR